MLQDTFQVLRMRTPKSRTVSGSSCRIALVCLSTTSRVLKFVLTHMAPFSDSVTLGGLPMKVKRIDLPITHITIDRIRGLEGVLRHGLDA